MAKNMCGSPHPDAPPELAQFAFLIGTWRCAARLKGDDGEWRTTHADWEAFYILDGYVIADVFRPDDPESGLPFGATYRSYDAVNKTWVMKFLDARTSTWMDLGPPELGGCRSMKMVPSVSCTVLCRTGCFACVSRTFLETTLPGGVRSPAMAGRCGMKSS